MVYRLTASKSDIPFSIFSERKEKGSRVCIKGEAIAKNVRDIVASFREALSLDGDVEIDLAGVSTIDARFLGVLLVLRKVLEFKGREMKLTGVTATLERIIGLHGADFLLAPPERSSDVQVARSHEKNSSVSKNN